MGRQNATHEEVISAAKAAQADEFIQKIPAGYEGIIAEKGASLSGGQKQRLSISRAVLKNLRSSFLMIPLPPSTLAQKQSSVRR